MTLKFTIVLAILLALASFQQNTAESLTEKEENPFKNYLLFRISLAKTRAFNHVQDVRKSAAVDTDKIFARVFAMVKKFVADMEVLRKKSGSADDFSCDDKAKDKMNDAALETIGNFRSCVLSVINFADKDLNSMTFNADSLTKKVLAAEEIDEELKRKVSEIDMRSIRFSQYRQKLRRCKIPSALPSLKRQLSKFLVSYKKCL